MSRVVAKSVLVLTAATLSWQCTKSKSEAADPAATAGEDGTDGAQQAGTVQVGLASALSASYPEGLALSAFPKAVDEQPGVAAAGTVAIGTTLLDVCPPPPATQPEGCTPPVPGGTTTQDADGEFKPFDAHPKDQLEASEKRLKGDVDDCFGEDIGRAFQQTANNGDVCYGFDYGLVSGAAMGNFDGGQVNDVIKNIAPADQNLAGVKAALAGISGLTPDTTPEACMVKVGRQLVESAAARVQGSLRLFEGMLCQAKKDAVATELPAVDEELDLKAVFSKFANATVSEASVKRLADRDGRAVYRSRVTFTLTGGKESTVTLVHSPGAAGNTSYEGVLWFESSRIDDQNHDEYAVVTSVTYAKTGGDVADQRLRMEVRDADFNKSKVTGYVSGSGAIDLNAGADANGSFGPGDPNDYLETMRYFAFDVNPSSYEGNIAFWKNPGGNYTEAARGFVFESKQQEDGTLAGCAYAGAVRDTSIRKAVKESVALEPTGCYTPQLNYGACANGAGNMGTQIWKQCFKQGTDGLYTLDTANIDNDAQGFDVIDLASSHPTLPAVDVSATGVSGGDVRDAP